jgi:hypothetical protein
MARKVRWRVAINRGPVVGNRNFEAGKKAPLNGLLQATGGEPETGFEEENHTKIEQRKAGGAMSEQHGHGNDSSPQKFIHLIGCRDKARTRTHRR